MTIDTTVRVVLTCLFTVAVIFLYALTLSYAYSGTLYR